MHTCCRAKDLLIHAIGLQDLLEYTNRNHKVHETKAQRAQGVHTAVRTQNRASNRFCYPKVGRYKKSIKQSLALLVSRMQTLFRQDFINMHKPPSPP